MDEPNREAEKVTAWRQAELERAGYDPDAAQRLAPRLDINLHEAIDLLKHKCPADIALEILL